MQTTYAYFPCPILIHTASDDLALLSVCDACGGQCMYIHPVVLFLFTFLMSVYQLQLHHSMLKFLLSNTGMISFFWVQGKLPPWSFQHLSDFSHYIVIKFLFQIVVIFPWSFSSCYWRTSVYPQMNKLLWDRNIVYKWTFTRQIAARRRTTRTSGGWTSGAAGWPMGWCIGGSGAGAAGRRGSGGGMGAGRPTHSVWAAWVEPGATVGLKEDASRVVHTGLQR